MRIAVIHNFYQKPGGEDGCYDSEARMLEAEGHEVLRIEEHNDSISRMTLPEVAIRTLWNERSRRRIATLLREHRIELAHFHNTFPLISPAAYYGAKAAGAAVVQTLHNYRLACPGALLYRADGPCEACVGRAIAWPGILHGCYRGSRAGTASVAAMLALHRALRTYSRKVDVIIALTEFARQKMIAGGLPADRLVVKPNFAETDLMCGSGGGDYVVYVGRLTQEKGVGDLLAAWETGGEGLPELRILGQGPLASQVQDVAARCSRVVWLGQQPASAVGQVIGEARLLLCPSRWYEGMPRTVIESLARGTPVVATRIGGLPEMVRPGRNGALFDPGDSAALAETVLKLLAAPALLADLRRGARQSYDENYLPKRNYQLTMEIYRRAVERHSGEAGRAVPLEA